MRTPVFLITAAAMLPLAAWAQTPATPVRPAAPAVRVKPTAVAPETAPVQVVPAKPLSVTPAPPAARGTYDRRFFTKDLLTMQPEPRVDVNLEDATVREALKQVFGQAHQEYHVEEDVPDEPRVTLRAKNLRLSTALQLVLPEEGVRTTLFVKDGKGTLRVYKVGGINAPLAKSGLNVLTETFNFELNPNGTVKLPESLPERVKQFLRAHPDLNLNAAVPYILNLQEQRSTFRCPHCKGQSTVIRKADQPKCEKCNRTFLPDWQFCPADGTKRPASTSEWHFCPFCGKRVEGEKNAGIPFLEDLPYLGRLFRSNTPATAAPEAPAVPAPRKEPQQELPGSPTPGTSTSLQ